MKLKQLLTAIEYRAEQVPDVDITDLVYDSRKAVPGCAFVCLRGANADGHKYAKMAAEKGAAVIIAEEIVEAPVPVILTENTRLALAYLSAEFFGHPAEQMHVIGITGTKGKTTTAFMMRSILEAAGHKTGVIGTIGVLYGDTLVQTDNTTPENYEVQKFMRQMVDAGCEYCVMEVSSIGLKDHRVAGFTFELGLFTNFSEDHIGGAEHKDMAEYMACKSMLFRMCRTGIINIDDPNYTGIIKNHTCNIVTYGYDKSADLVAHGEELVTTPGFLGVRFSVTGKLNFTADVAIPGKFNVYNALCAITACSVLNIPVTAIVVTGANGSQCHGIPGNTQIKKGDLITMDTGAMLAGYHSDMTRTVALGYVNDEQRAIYNTVLKAQLAVIDGARPGMRCCDVDKIARDIIETPYPNTFGHGLGHGVGFEIHEWPRFNKTDETICEPGMVITDEPGIYIPGKCGVRIEDMLLITDDGCRSLTHSPKELIIL